MLSDRAEVALHPDDRGDTFRGSERAKPLCKLGSPNLDQIGLFKLKKLLPSFYVGLFVFVVKRRRLIGQGVVFYAFSVTETVLLTAAVVATVNSKSAELEMLSRSALIQSPLTGF
jgi:hypothetical protein